MWLKRKLGWDDPKQRRLALFILLAVVICIGGAGFWFYWKYFGSRYVSTENAYTAADIALVTAEIDGTVKEISVVDTQRVKKGDVLVLIDPTDTSLALKQAEAEKARAEAKIAASISDLERAEIDLKRRAALAGSGSVSGDELTHAKNSDASARSALASSRATVALAQARYDKAKVDFGRTVIRSPIDGVIARRQVQLGQRVQPSVPLLSVVPLREMYVNANFKEVELKKVRAGQKVKLISDLYGDDIVYHGVVDGFSGGTGSAFALIPAQNATGNWIKVVQRLPVRVRLQPDELDKHPLRVGLSMSTTIDVRSARQ